MQENQSVITNRISISLNCLFPELCKSNMYYIIRTMDIVLKYETDLFCCTGEIGDSEARPRLSFF